MASFTCLSCLVGFKAPEDQREHFKTDWHRYNLKRKVAELPPVSAETFLQKALIQQGIAAAPKTSLYCEACRKKFGSEKSYANHQQSYKHIENAMKPVGEKKDEIVQIDERIDDEIEDADTDDSDVEEVDSDEWDDDEGLPTTTCLFCPKESGNLEANLTHLSKVHSFYIPDFEFVTDIEGLMTYLGRRVGAGKVCMWCGHKGRQFHSLEALQKHMADKGHCRMFHEGETLIEYEEFYDYSTSYPDAAVANPDDEVDIVDNDFEMTLPSGAVIGHRSLFRYYRQKLNPNPRIARQQRGLPYALSQIKALGWTNKVSSKEAIERKIRDLSFMKKIVNQKHMQLGVKANKLQTHFRHQILQ